MLYLSLAGDGGGVGFFCSPRLPHLPEASPPSSRFRFGIRSFLPSRGVYGPIPCEKRFTFSSRPMRGITEDLGRFLRERLRFVFCVSWGGGTKGSRSEAHRTIWWSHAPSAAACIILCWLVLLCLRTSFIFLLLCCNNKRLGNSISRITDFSLFRSWSNQEPLWRGHLGEQLFPFLGSWKRLLHEIFNS